MKTQDFRVLVRAVSAANMERLADNEENYICELEEKHKSLTMFSPRLLADLAFCYKATWGLEDVDFDATRWQYLAHVVDLLPPE